MRCTIAISLYCNSVKIQKGSCTADTADGLGGACSVVAGYAQSADDRSYDYDVLPRKHRIQTHVS